MITLTLHSPEPPAVVLSALRAHAGEWRASHLPDALRAARVSAIECNVQASSCTLSYRRHWYGPIERGLALRVRCAVLPAPGGTMVQIAAGYSVRAPIFAAILLSAVVVVGAVLSPVPAGLLVALFAAVFAVPFLLARNMNRHLSRAGDPEADYLISRVEDAVAAAGSVSSPTPAS